MTKENSNGVGFFDLDHFPITLTYIFTEPATVMSFKCKMALADDDKEARQAFYKKSAGDQAKGQHDYHVDLLSRILIDEPDGVPGWPTKKHTEDGGETYALPDKVKSFFGPASPMKVKVCSDLIELYNRAAMPLEFFR